MSGAKLRTRFGQDQGLLTFLQVGDKFLKKWCPCRSRAGNHWCEPFKQSKRDHGWAHRCGWAWLYTHVITYQYHIITVSKWHFSASTAPNSPRTRTEDGYHSVSILAALAAYVSENSCCEIDPANGFAGFYTVRETPNSLIRKVFHVLEDGQHRRSHFDAKPQIPRRMER